MQVDTARRERGCWGKPPDAGSSESLQRLGTFSRVGSHSNECHRVRGSRACTDRQRLFTIPIMPGSNHPVSAVPMAVGAQCPDGKSVASRTSDRVETWLRMVGTAEDAGIGVACGRGLICIDIDQDVVLVDILPPLPRCRRRVEKASHCFFRATLRRLGRATIALKSTSAYRGSKMFSRASNKVPTNQSINEVLRRNRVAGSVVSYDSLYRKRSAGHYEFPVLRERWRSPLRFPVAPLTGLGPKSACNSRSSDRVGRSRAHAIGLRRRLSALPCCRPYA